MKSLASVPAYEKFIKERDQGLERVLTKYSVQLSGITAKLKDHTEQVAAHQIVMGKHKDQLKKSRQHFHDQIETFFQMGIERSTALVKAMQHTVITISAAGHAVAIAATLKKDAKLSLPRGAIDAMSKDELDIGGTIDARIEIGFHRLLRDAVDAFQLSQVMSSTPEETIARIGKVFPKKIKAKKPKVMAKMHEAGRKRPEDNLPDLEISEEGIYPANWDKAVEDYLSDYVAVDRAPYAKIFEPEAEAPEYFQKEAWQVESDITDAFVDSVRSGENEAANQAGITDFVWLAIVDSKTDDCCFARDGLLVSEIETKLDNGEDMGDCDATSPAAHPRCRCRLAPATDDMPEESLPDFGSFDDWLSEKANG